jgi:hypothetical protein
MGDASTAGLLNLSDGSVSIELVPNEQDNHEQDDQQPSSLASDDDSHTKQDLVNFSGSLLSGLATAEVAKGEGNAHFRKSDLPRAIAAYSASVDTLRNLIDAPEFALLCRTTPGLLEDAHVRLSTVLLNLR